MTLEGRGSRHSLLETAARNERKAVLSALTFVVIVGLYLTVAAGNRLMLEEQLPAGTVVHALMLFLMWWTMMMAMMLPTAAPAILTYAAIRRNFVARGTAQPPLAAFVSGYAAVWTLFSAAAVALQLATSEFISLTPMYALTSALVGGVLLVCAGLYQFTPLKQACLRHCQSPLFYLSRRWRNDSAGAFALGFRHGVFCLGCCWVLMLLLFYGGVMELKWIVGLAAYVALEKLIPARSRFAGLAGVALIVWGLSNFYRAFN